MSLIVPAAAQPMVQPKTGIATVPWMQFFASLQSQLDPGALASFANVKEYGAAGDGITDDTAAIQAAVDSGFAIILFPAGTYLVTGTINITHTVRIIGCSIDFEHRGVAKVLIFSNSIANDYFHINANNCTVEGIDLSGQGGRAVNNTHGRGIAVGTVSRTVTDGSMNVGSNILSSATANFTSADVGTYALCVGAYNGDGGQEIIGFTDSQHVTLSANADNHVTGATTHIAPVIVGTTLRDLSTASQSIGVDFVNASNFVLDRCVLNGFYALKVNSIVADKGDSAIDKCDFSAPTTSGAACIRWRASGGLRIANSKFLTAYDHINIFWTTGTSGGPVIVNCSFENVKNYIINAAGDSSHVMNGFMMSNCWMNGGLRQIHIDDTLPVKNLALSNLCMSSGGGTTMAYIGALVSGFNIAGGVIDGNSVGGITGISVAAGAANGQINCPRIVNVTTRISSASSSTYYDDFPLTATPTPTSGTGALTSATASTAYSRVADRCLFSTVISIVTNGTGANSIIVALPITPADGAEAGYMSGQVGGVALSCQVSGSNLVITKYDGTYPGGSGVTLHVGGQFRV